MTNCVCCQQGHKNVKAKVDDHWCRQCQKDGCPQPTIYCESSDVDEGLLHDDLERRWPK